MYEHVLPWGALEADAQVGDADVMIMEVDQVDQAVADDPMPDEFIWRGPGVGPATGRPMHDMDPLPLHDVPSSEVGLLSFACFHS